MPSKVWYFLRYGGQAGANGNLCPAKSFTEVGNGLTVSINVMVRYEIYRAEVYSLQSGTLKSNPFPCFLVQAEILRVVTAFDRRDMVHDGILCHT